MVLALRAATAQAEVEQGGGDNPYEAAGDSTQECYTWAADGQCASNPQYMLSSCKYSCWEWYSHRRSTFPDAPIDKQFECHSWSQSGECHKNAAYMRTQCPEVCKDRYEPPDEPPPPPPPPKGEKKGKKKKKRKKRQLGAKDEV